MYNKKITKEHKDSINIILTEFISKIGYVRTLLLVLKKSNKYKDIYLSNISSIK